ncbi:MAG: hypothetical protein EOO81_10775 [Oxalobacteraceae bacterium]|nr:MAG: hypothetical protein EOO81_10775 [Oxalobacteraceae bacterium]
MDFLKILKSLEEALYEIMAWLMFFPRTLVRVLAHPQQMAVYAQSELRDAPESQYDDALSPPLFLMLAVLVAHGIEIAMHMQSTQTSQLLKTVAGTEEGILLYRCIGFALWPLIASAHMLHRKGIRITRSAMLEPFYAQCYLTAPFAITISTAQVFIRLPGATSTNIGLVVACLALAWYALVQVAWLKRQLNVGWTNASLSNICVLALGVGLNLILSNVVFGSNDLN